jgi:hypothetical protein
LVWKLNGWLEMDKNRIYDKEIAGEHVKFLVETV